MSAAWRGRKVTIDKPVTSPGDNPWTFFDTSNPWLEDGTFVVVDTGAVAHTPTTYETLVGLAPGQHVWYVKAGKNTSPTTHAGGRTGIPRFYFRGFADHQGGDAPFFNFNFTLKNHNPEAIDYTAEPWSIIFNGSFGWEATGAGAVAQFSEWLYDDCGVSGGVMDYTRSFKRTAAPHANGAPWGAFRLQSTALACDYVLSVGGVWDRIFDTSPATCDKPIIMAADQWIHWNATAAPDLNGSQLYATDFGNVRTGYRAASQSWDVQFGNLPALRLRSVLSPSNYLAVQARETGIGVFISAEGADEHIDIVNMTKGGGSHQFRSHGFGPVQFLIAACAGAVNWLQAMGGSGVVDLSANGAGDADLRLSGLGTGKVRFGTHQPIGSETITGYITIKDSAGALRKLAVLS